jgi:hypothetical protein
VQIFSTACGIEESLAGSYGVSNDLNNLGSSGGGDPLMEK